MAHVTKRHRRVTVIRAWMRTPGSVSLHPCPLWVFSDYVWADALRVTEGQPPTAPGPHHTTLTAQWRKSFCLQGGSPKFRN